MNKNNCVFCKIANGEIPKDFIHKNKDILAFNDINPLAPIHILIIPRLHIESITDLEKKHEALMGKLITSAQKIAEKKKIAKNGYKLLFRVGSHGGQEVQHIHLHLLGGAPLSENIHPL